MIDLRPVGFIIGVLLSVLASAMMLPALADAAARHQDWPVFIAAGSVTLFAGVSLVFTCRGRRVAINLRQAFLLTILGWLSCVAFAALPFAFASAELSYADAFFEAMSGLTTTGATVIIGLDHAPPGLLLWRGLLQWMGGLGIIAMAIIILPMLRIGGMQLFRLESTEKLEKALPRAAQIAGGIGTIYLSMSAACAVLYWLVGMTGFDAVIHAMTTVATGGFSTADASLAAFKNPWAEVIAIIFMMLGGVSFTLFLRVLQGDRRALWIDRQVQIYFALAIVASLIVAAWLWLESGEHPLIALRYGAFNVISVMTTTGYSSSDYGQFGALPMVLFAVLMLVGGCSGSTTGGIKVFRFQILFEVSRAHIRHALLPSGVFVPKYNRRHITDQVTHSVVSFMFLYGLTIVAIAAGLGFYGLDIVTAFSGAASAVSNLGPGLGHVIGPAGNFASLPDGAKWMLSFGMLLGRLELVTVLVLLSSGFWRS